MEESNRFTNKGFSSVQNSFVRKLQLDFWDEIRNFGKIQNVRDLKLPEEKNLVFY